MKKLFVASLILFVALQLCGCVRRIVTIESQPEGAQVYFDRKLIGRTPCSHEFLYYGTHRLELVKEGYTNLQSRPELKGPVYEYFPLSFFSEVLVPWQITDAHNFTFKLEKGQSKEPVISPVEQPQTSLPSAQLERIEGKQ